MSAAQELTFALSSRDAEIARLKSAVNMLRRATAAGVNVMPRSPTRSYLTNVLAATAHHELCPRCHDSGRGPSGELDCCEASTAIAKGIQAAHEARFDEMPV